MTDRQRRVLVLNHFAAPMGEAGGTRHVELFSRLGAPWEYLVVASDLNPQTNQRVASAPGFSVVAVPEYSQNGVRRILNWLTYAIRAFFVGVWQPRISVVYASSPHLFAGLSGWAISAIRRRPFVLEIRDLWPQILVDMGALERNSPVYRALLALENFLYKRAHQIVVLAKGTEEHLVARGVPAAIIHYIPNGPDPSDFEPSGPREELRAQFEFDRFTAVYAGAHGPANGLDLLLDAAAALTGDDIDVVFVGGGIEKDRLVSRAVNEGISHARFLDPIPKSSIPDLLAAADLGLHVLADVDLFQTAVSPNKLFDYMAAGLPVMTNCPGVVGDLVVEAGCGLVVAPTELAAGLSEALRMKCDLPELGLAGRAWIAAHQSRTSMAERLNHVLVRANDAR